jgi:hypothetical protein
MTRSFIDFQCRDGTGTMCHHRTFKLNEPKRLKALRSREIFRLEHISCGNTDLQLGHGIYSVETVSSWPVMGAACSLQLGHGIFSVETESPTTAATSALMLQLGHGIYSVETAGIKCEA